jgi:hypothetical protein
MLSSMMASPVKRLLRGPGSEGFNSGNALQVRVHVGERVSYFSHIEHARS